MNTDIETQVLELQQTVVAIMDRLPPERLPNLVEYARFLEYQATSGETETAKNELDQSDGDAKWDELLAQPKAKHLLRELAQDALDEHEAGLTTEIGRHDEYERMLK